MVTWMAARAAQQHARPDRTAEPAVAPGTGGAAALWLFADGCLNLAFMISASPGPGRPGRDVHHLVECRRSRTKGSLAALFYGRTHIAGMESGRRIRLHAVVGVGGNGRPTVINPRYELGSDEQQARPLVPGHAEG